MAPAKIPKHRLPAGACENFHKVSPKKLFKRRKNAYDENLFAKNAFILV
jgi:hypothetical protein